MPGQKENLAYIAEPKDLPILISNNKSKSLFSFQSFYSC